MMYRTVVVAAVTVMAFGCKRQATEVPSVPVASEVAVVSANPVSPVEAPPVRTPPADAVKKPVFSDEVWNMPGGPARAKQVKREAIELKREASQSAMIKASMHLDSIEQELRRDDPEINRLYREMEDKRKAYREALASRSDYAGGWQEMTELSGQHQRLTKQLKALKEEMDNE